MCEIHSFLLSPVMFYVSFSDIHNTTSICHLLIFLPPTSRPPLASSGSAGAVWAVTGDAAGTLEAPSSLPQRHLQWGYSHWLCRLYKRAKGQYDQREMHFSLCVRMLLHRLSTGGCKIFTTQLQVLVSDHRHAGLTWIRLSKLFWGIAQSSISLSIRVYV